MNGDLPNRTRIYNDRKTPAALMAEIHRRHAFLLRFATVIKLFKERVGKLTLQFSNY